MSWWDGPGRLGREEILALILMAAAVGVIVALLR